MAEIGKVTPGSSIITRLPREQAATDHKEHQQEPAEDTNEQEERHEEEQENNKSDKDGGIDLYV